MKHVTGTGIDTYRVQCVYPWNRHLLGRRFARSDGKGRIWATRPWRMTWQAEWDGCQWAARAYTEPGVIRKAKRWIATERTGRRPIEVAVRRWIRRVRS